MGLDSEHALLSPSSSGAWLDCTALLLAKSCGKALDEWLAEYRVKIFEAKPHFSERGTLMHKEAEMYFNGEMKFEAVGNEVKDYIKLIEEEVLPFADKGTAEIEKKFNVFPPLCWGTADLSYLKNGVPTIGDLKTGRFNVSPSSTQLGIYLIGYQLYLYGDIKKDGVAEIYSRKLCNAGTTRMRMAALDYYKEVDSFKEKTMLEHERNHPLIHSIFMEVGFERTSHNWREDDLQFLFNKVKKVTEDLKNHVWYTREDKESPSSNVGSQVSLSCMFCKYREVCETAIFKKAVTDIIFNKGV